MNSPATRAQRNRLGQALAMGSVMALGLLWRSPWIELPGALRKYGGDALWALLVFLGFGFLFPGWAGRRIAVLALAFSALVEFSQLYHAPWIDSLRATRLGALALGAVFNRPDLPAYALGIVLGLLGEWWLANWLAARRKTV